MWAFHRPWLGCVRAFSSLARNLVAGPDDEGPADSLVSRAGDEAYRTDAGLLERVCKSISVEGLAV